MRNKIIMTCLLLLFKVSFLFGYNIEEEDDFLDEILQDYNLQETDSSDEYLYIEDINIVITGSTRQNWVENKLIIKKNQQYKSNIIQKKINLQKNYFDSTKLFYSSNIYLMPGNKENSYILNVELVDGFFQLYNFYPWDLMWGIRHLLNGNELLYLTLGYNTQSIEWIHPNVGDSLFSYSVFVEHYYGDIFFDEKVNSTDFAIKLYASPSIYLETGVEGEYKFLSIKTTKNNMLKYGGFINLIPYVELLKPIGLNFMVSAGGISDLGRHNGIYLNLEERFLYKPIRFFSIELFSDFKSTLKIESPCLMPDTREFRAPVELERNNLFNRNYIQINYEKALSFSLGFTRLYINPFIFFENAVTVNQLSCVTADRYYYSTGGAVSFEFGMPVNLHFVFGVKQLVYPFRKTGFLFNVQYELY